jgi:hypothetical protein
MIGAPPNACQVGSSRLSLYSTEYVRPATASQTSVTSPPDVAGGGAVFEVASGSYDFVVKY